MASIDRSGQIANVTIRTNTDLTLVFDVEPFDLTGASCDVHINAGETTQIIPTTLDVAGFRITATIARAITATLPPQSAYIVYVTDAADHRSCVMSGTITTLAEPR